MAVQDADTDEPDEGPVGERAGDDGAEVVPKLPPGDRAELRLLLSLRYRIRNDIGLPEDAYDRLLDELPSKPGTIAGGLPDTTTSASAPASRSTRTASPSVIAPDSRPLAN